MAIWVPDASWEKTGMETLEAYERRSHCIHYHVAAVYFKDKRPIAIGYNGPVSGFSHCDETSCVKLSPDGNKKLPPGVGPRCVGLHAEINGLINADQFGISLVDSWLFCSYSPCWDCAKVLVQLPIAGCTYRSKYDGDGDLPFWLFEWKGIILRQYQSDIKRFLIKASSK